MELVRFVLVLFVVELVLVEPEFEVFEQVDKFEELAFELSELFDIAAFGLPEVKGEEIQKAKQCFANKEQTLVACAGCYPTELCI